VRQRNKKGVQKFLQGLKERERAAGSEPYPEAMGLAAQLAVRKKKRGKKRPDRSYPARPYPTRRRKPNRPDHTPLRKKRNKKRRPKKTSRRRRSS
jgi:hypothetical protein